ncbi:MAG: FAD-binding oxidoreductase [Rhodobacteraceae bacterium]|nr:FAD-binding oxidoreductase [Paracoccaceae bacterium]
MIDFLVIGGGIAGISAGARLSHLGRVVLLEVETGLGYHASGRSAALFEVHYGSVAGLALNEVSRDYHMTANGGVLSPRGIMLVGGIGQEEQFERDRAKMSFDKISIDEARGHVPILNPETMVAAAYREDSWDIDTDRLIQNFAKEIRANGGEVRTSARVEQIVRTANGWQVTAGGDTLEARILVDAAGAWADEVARMAGVMPLGLQPMRRSMARLPAPGGLDISRWPMILAAGEDWYAKPDAGKLLVSPAEEDPVEPHDAWADDMVLAEGLARYEAMVTEPVTRLETSWAGLRTFTSDRQPALGFAADDPAFLWVAGQGGSGFQCAPAASQLVADLVAGREPEVSKDIVKAVDPARLQP